MSLGTLILTAAVAQNVILVHFLAPWPFPVLATSIRRSSIISAGVTGALVWVSLFYGVIYRFILQPLSAEFLGTLTLLGVLGTSYLLWTRIALMISPFAARGIRRSTPVIFLNTVVFVVPMGLVDAVDYFWYIPLVALAAGLGLFIALVPVSAIYAYSRTARIPAVLRGHVIMLLATAVFALALQQLSGVLAFLTYPLW